MRVLSSFYRDSTTLKFNLVILLSCLVTSLVSNGCGQAPLVTKAKGEGKVLTISPDAVVIEEATDQNESFVTLSIKNISSKSVEISASNPTCAYTLVTPLKSSQLKPGQSTELKLSGRPPAYGQSTASFTLKTSHPLLPVLQIPVVLRGKEQVVPNVLSVPESVHLSQRGGQTNASARWIVTCVEHFGEAPWLQGFAAEDERVEIWEPVVEDLQRTSETTLIRQYTFQATVIGESDDMKNYRIPLKWLVQNEGTGSLPKALSLVVDAVPYLRIVPDPIVADVSEKNVVTVERQCLIFFDDENRRRIAISKELPDGISVRVDPDTSMLPGNAVRILLRINAGSVGIATSGDQIWHIPIPVNVEEQPDLNGVINLRLRRPPDIRIPLSIERP